jgi:hypothetical protein
MTLLVGDGPGPDPDRLTAVVPVAPDAVLGNGHARYPRAAR